MLPMVVIAASNHNEVTECSIGDNVARGSNERLNKARDGVRGSAWQELRKMNINRYHSSEHIPLELVLLMGGQRLQREQLLVWPTPLQQPFQMP